MIGLQVGPIFYKIGTGNFLHCFFSTIAYQIEGMEWGNEFPFIMNTLYNGELKPEDIESAKKELRSIKKEFSHLPPEAVIWDIENLDKKTPWRNEIDKNMADLSNYFITSDGKNLFNVFEKAFTCALKVNMNIQIKSL